MYPYTSGRMTIAASRPTSGKIAVKNVAVEGPIALKNAAHRSQASTKIEAIIIQPMRSPLGLYFWIRYAVARSASR